MAESPNREPLLLLPRCHDAEGGTVQEGRIQGQLLLQLHQGKVSNDNKKNKPLKFSTMKTKNQKRFTAWAVVTVTVIIIAAVTVNYVVIISSIVPIGMLAYYGNEIDKDNSRKSNDENNESHE